MGPASCEQRVLGYVNPVSPAPPRRPQSSSRHQAPISVLLAQGLNQGEWRPRGGGRRGKP